MNPRTILRVMKVVHTVIWAFFVLMICAIWVFAAQTKFVAAARAIAVVLIEVAVLGFNHGQCPLGKIVERYTDDRAANFDIYLPTWLAGCTKPVSDRCSAGASFSQQCVGRRRPHEGRRGCSI
ncbi:MAG: hypothetical protein ABI395_03065 [Sphingobium sp.]